MSLKERRLSARLAKAKSPPRTSGTSLDAAFPSPSLKLDEVAPPHAASASAPASPDPIVSSDKLARSPVARTSLAANTAANASRTSDIDVQPSGSKPSRKSNESEVDEDAAPSPLSAADAAEAKVSEAILELVRRSGVRVLKVGRKGPSRRAQLLLSKDGGRLVWKSKRTRKEDGIVLANVRRVTVKQVSRNFSRINRSSIFRHTSSPVFDPRSLSMYDNTTKKSLDVVVQPSKLLLRTVLELRKKGLIMEKEDEMALVVETIRNEVERRAAILQAEPVHQRYVKKLFEEADLTKKGTVNLKEALALCKKIQLGQSAKVVTLAFEALASVEAWPGSSKKKVGELNLEGFEALLMELGGNHDEASLWATMHLQHLEIAQISAKNFAKSNSRKLISPSDTLHEFLKGCAKGSTVDFAETKIDITSIVNVLLKIQGESPQAAVAFLRNRQLQVPRSLREAAKNARRRARESAAGGRSAVTSNATDGSDSGSDSDTDAVKANLPPTAAPSNATSPSYERQKASDAQESNKPAALRRASQLLAFNAVTAAALATSSSARTDENHGSGGSSSNENPKEGGETETSIVNHRSQKTARRSFVSLEGGDSGASDMLGMLSAASQALFSQAETVAESPQEQEDEPKRSGVTFGGLSSSSRASPKCGSEVFSALVNDPDNTLLGPVHLKSVYQDMDRPLSEYWIASSHNTYLTGDQLASASSVDRYIDDLMEGCRCVEIDTWDSRDGSGEPIVYHGGTLTSKVLFRDVIQAIGDYGFVNNPFPIILSFEDHCSKPYQLKMAEYIKKSLHERGLLWLPPESTLHPDGAGLPATRLPSPKEAKNFVLVKAKVKRFKDKKRSRGNTVSSAAESSGGDAENAPSGGIDKKPSENDGEDEVDDDLKGLDRNRDLEDQEEETINELDDLVAIKGSKLKSLVTSLESPQVEMIHSLKESKMDKVIRKSGVNLLKYTENKLMRVYPDNLRVDSSNYNPMPSWLHGSQLVALNYQTPDVPMWVYRGKFRDNGGCGYLLRPPFFQQKSEFKAALRQQRRTSTMLTATQQRRLLKIEERSGLKKFSSEEVQLAVGDEVTWMSSDEDLSPGTVGRVTIVYGDGDVEVFFPEAHNEQKEFTFSSHRLNLVRQAIGSEGPSKMSHLGEGAAMKTWSQEKSWMGRPAMNGLVATNEDSDDDNGGSESDGSDGMPDDEQNDSENEDERWTPPRKFKEYIAHSEWATEAMTLCVRVISASHLPMPAIADSGQRERSKTVDLDSEEKDESKEEDEFMTSQGEASLEVELLGAPCDNKKWTNSRAAGNEGTKHIFDQAIVVNIAEPRLALLKFVVLRKGVAIAQTVVPVHRMRSGLRWTQLYSPEAFSDKVSADYLLTRLLVMVERKPFIPPVQKSNFAQIWGSVKGAFGKKKLPPGLMHESIAGLDANKSPVSTDPSNLGDDELSRRLRQAQEEAEERETQAFWENSGTKKPLPASATPAKSALKTSKHSGPPRRASFAAVAT